MAKTTPEGLIKKEVYALLAEYDIRPAKDAGTFTEAAGWYFMAGSSGFGTSGIPDIIGHYYNNFFSLETKKPGAKPKGFQALQVEAIVNSGGFNLVVDGDSALAEFREWLERIKEERK